VLPFITVPFSVCEVQSNDAPDVGLISFANAVRLKQPKSSLSRAEDTAVLQ
jgi:hypothetical protein